MLLIVIVIKAAASMYEVTVTFLYHTMWDDEADVYLH